VIWLPLLQAQPIVAPSPDHPGFALGTDLSSYNVTNSFETGYRFSQVGGDSSFYRGTVNYGNGLRLLSSAFTANSKDGHGYLFDAISLSTQGLGNDPYQVATFRIEKNDVYRYDMSWRLSNYFNPSLDNGDSDTVKNTRRIMQDHDLTVSLAKWAKLKLGYSRNHESGPEFSNYELYIGGLARDVLPIDRDTRRDWNEYRVGSQFDFHGFRLTLSHQWEYYKDDSSIDSLVPGQIYPLPLSQPYQPALPVTYPTLATAYSRGQPTHGVNQGWFANLNKNRKLWAINARMTYNKGDNSMIYSENESGAAAIATTTPAYPGSVACSNCGVGGPANAATFMMGNARWPFTAGDVTFSLFPTSNLTIVNSTSAEANRYDGGGQMLQVSSVAATKNIYWLYHMGEGRVSDSLDSNYRLNKWLGLNAEYRYTDRWLVNDLVRSGTTNSKDLNTLDDHMNTGTFGIRLRPAQPLSVNVDATVGRDSGAETPISPAHFHNIRARAEYRVQKRVRFAGTYRQIYNLNAPVGYSYTLNAAYGAPPAAYYASHSRDLSFNSSFTVNRNLSLDASYSKTHLDTLANLWAEIPSSPTLVVSERGYVSQYVSNVHTVSLMARTTLHRGTFYAGYNIARDTGDGRAVQNLGLQDPAASYLAGLNTFPMTYQAPMARLSIKITEKMRWNGGWEFYRYNQKFAYFGYMPYYRAQTGYTSLSWAF
jgi:hypothetical protein